MEYLAKIELRGIVGMSKVSNFGNTKAARFSLYTETAHKGNDGSCVIDCMWFSCTAWESEKNNISQLQKGSKVHLIGRVRMQRYTDTDGCERQIWEVVVSEMEIL